MRNLLAALLLVPVLAFGQGLNVSAPGASAEKYLGRFAFSAPGCYASGTGGVTITRTTAATVVANGTMYACTSGQYRVGDQGLLVEPASRNNCLQSNTISSATSYVSPWSANGSTVTTVAGFIDGTSSWAQITGAGSAGPTQTITTASNASVTVSAWVQAPSSPGPASIVVGGCPAALTTCTCGASDGGACTATMADPAEAYCAARWTSISTTPTRIWVRATCASASTSRPIYLIPNSYGGAGGTMRFGGVQVEVGTVPSSLMITTSSALDRNADSVSVSNPLSGFSGAWCVAGTWAPLEGVAWGTPLNGVLWSTYTSGAAENYANLSMGTNLVATVADPTGGTRTASVTSPGYAVGSSHRIVTCGNGTALSISVDGAVTSGAASGAGTGVPTWGASMWLANQGNGSPFGGYIKGVKVCKAKSAKECR